MRQLLTATLAAVLALALVTCATPPLEDLDAPGGLDVALLDVTPDAAAETFDVACDVEVRGWIDYGDGRYSRSTLWYAEAEVPGLDPARIESVTAVLCDFERWSTAAPTTCPDGATCTFDPPLAPPDCRVTAGDAQITGNTVRVNCGNRSEGQSVAPPGTPAPYDRGERARSVRIIVR